VLSTTNQHTQGAQGPGLGAPQRSLFDEQAEQPEGAVGAGQRAEHEDLHGVRVGRKATVAARVRKEVVGSQSVPEAERIEGSDQEPGQALEDEEDVGDP
jgi:hypothetical protein